jgi:hypothetical protein
MTVKGRSGSLIRKAFEIADQAVAEAVGDEVQIGVFA